MGAGSKVYDSFNNIGSPSSWNVDECRGSFCPNFFRHTILDFWDHLSVDEVKLVIYKNKTAVVNMVFNGRNTNLRNWFSREKLKSSPWSDLPAAGVNLFAMNRFHQRRNFYISSLHNGCEADKGWLYVLEIAHCEFEKRIPLPVIIYSGDNSRIRWNNNFEKADSMAIFIRLEE
ncbi:uncharacterized protein LOC106880085 [Octopus bimaculoides]|nr:uncharacterized protein LOC106880085 [Octopus bimaculoides]|eukprot:XP_014785385.1 PREDICTED: uncharacterized protein LOC106880085 [Octopus bimaculoides]